MGSGTLERKNEIANRTQHFPKMKTSIIPDDGPELDPELDLPADRWRVPVGGDAKVLSHLGPLHVVQLQHGAVDEVD